MPLNPIEEAAEEASCDVKKESKGMCKDKDRGSTPPSKMILKTLIKNRERMKESLSSLKVKPSKTENGEDKNKLTSELHLNEELGSISSGISDTKSIGSDTEMIPLTALTRNMNSLAVNSVPDQFSSEYGYSNGNDHKAGDVNIPLISESDKSTS